MISKKLCSIQSCGKPHLAKSYCQLHYYRQKRGLPVLGATRFTRRPAITEGSIAKIRLGNGKGFAIIDAEYAWIDKHNWSLDGYGYPCTWHEGKIVKIHHMIIGKPGKGLVVDHIDRNPLNNRISNLRFVTQKANILNSHNSAKRYWKENTQPS